MPSNKQQGLELKALHGAFEELLLPKITRNKAIAARISTTISNMVQNVYGEKLNAEQLAHNAPSELFSITLDALEKNLEALSKEARGIAEVILKIRNDINIQEEPKADLPIDAFGKRIGGIIRALESEGILFDESDYPSNLPEKSKIPLKFELFELLAEEAGISVEQFMDNPKIEPLLLKHWVKFLGGRSQPVTFTLSSVRKIARTKREQANGKNISQQKQMNKQGILTGAIKTGLNLVGMITYRRTPRSHSKRRPRRPLHDRKQKPHPRSSRSRNFSKCRNRLAQLIECSKT